MHAKRLPTHLSIADKRAVERHKHVTIIAGRLTTPGFRLPGRLIFLERVTAKHKPVIVGREHTGRFGGVAFAVAPKTTAHYRLEFPGTPRLHSSHSRIVTVKGWPGRGSHTGGRAEPTLGTAHEMLGKVGCGPARPAGVGLLLPLWRQRLVTWAGYWRGPGRATTPASLSCGAACSRACCVTSRVLGCDDPDDVASETWLQVVRDLQRFNGGEDDFRRWLFTVGRHRAIDAAGQDPAAGQPGGRRPPGRLAGGQRVEEQVVDGMSVRQAIALLAGLSQDQAEAVALRVIAGLDTPAVAVILGKSPALCAWPCTAAARPGRRPEGPRARRPAGCWPWARWTE